MGLALARRYVNMGDQLDPTGSPQRVRPVADKMPVSPIAKMAVPRRARQSRPTIRLDLFYDMEFKTR